MKDALGFPDEARYRKAILNFTQNPFPEPPASNNLDNRPAQFMVGRSKQKEKLSQLYEAVSKSGDPKLVQIQGSQGVGKSTLASNFILEQKKKNQYIHFIPFETSGNKGDLNFTNFFSLMMQSFLKQTTLYEITYKIVSKILELYREQGLENFNRILERLHLSMSDYNKIQDDPLFLKEIDLKMADIKFIQRFTPIFGEKFNEIWEDLPSRDSEIYLVLFYVIFSSPEFLPAQRAIKGTGEFQGFDIRNEMKAKNQLKEFIDILKWLYPKSTLVLVIDHLEAGISNPEEVYNELFSFLLELRQIKHVFIILSGTFDAYLAIQENIREDRQSQIDNWALHNTLGLMPLSADEVNQIVQYHLNSLWRKKSLTTPSKYPLYPYTRQSVSYIYSYLQNDLRRLLEELYTHFQEMQKNQRVETISDTFDAIKKFRDQNSFVINRSEIAIFKEMILDKRVQDKQRSTNLEIAIYEMLKIIAKTTSHITNVKHEPKLGKGLKPDIYFEIGESLNNTRKVAIEVKVYRKGKEIPNKEVKKTHSLLKDNEIDYLLWISNKPLNSSKFNLPKSLHDRVGRSAELTDLELAYCSLLINRDKLWDKENIDVERAKQLLRSAGIDLDRHYSIAMGQVKNSGYPLMEQIVEPDVALYFDSVEQIEEVEDEIVEEEEELISHQPKLDGIYKDLIIKFITSKSHQKTMGISTIFTYMKKKKYNLEDIMSKDDAVILIRELASDEGYKTQTTKIIFSN